ncbi:type IV pilin [Haloplanus salinus]|jgi:FlaG/FlaF family flagellin (archaellin)|uniref:Type IV pilin n=1 Tax=Haloplanus salinus TaxID=1126245 RepID=A0A368NDX2_9EURY|nr:type IV pilin [Haloplanus salinus]RCU47651.1 type IV pilin [Haloplanus salinus]
MDGSGRSRASSTVIGNVLLIAVVVVLAGTASAYVFGVTDGSPDPAPTVAQSTGELVPQAGNDGGIVRITHRGGDTLRVADIEVAVDATDACGKRGRLVDLPVDGFGGNAIGSSNIEGDDIFDERPSYLGGPDPGALGQSTYTSDERLRFRIPERDCSIDDGARVTVRVVHTPTNAVVVERTLTA